MASNHLLPGRRRQSGFDPHALRHRLQRPEEVDSPYAPFFIIAPELSMHGCYEICMNYFEVSMTLMVIPDIRLTI